MKYAHLIKLTVFSYENENVDAILESCRNFFPFNLDENKIIIKNTIASGFNEKRIYILETTLANNNLINKFLRSIFSILDETQKKQILMQIDSRLDEHLDFFLRFDKDSWINGKKIVLTDSGKCFHARISIAAFPKKREIALNLIKELFNEK